MEKNCLVTKYKATVDDNSLLKVGEMFIDIIEQKSPTNISNCLYLDSSSDLVIEVENGEANITLDSNMESGWTNKITLQKVTSKHNPVYVKNGNYRLKVLSKYNLTEVGRWVEKMAYNAISVDTKYLKYSPNMTMLLCSLSGNLANIRGCTKLTRLRNLVKNQNFTGSLSDLASLTSLDDIVLIGNQNITGSLSDLAPLTALTNLLLSEFTNIIGSLSDLSPLTTLRGLSLNGCKNITGSLSDLAPLTNLRNVVVGNNPNITGNIKDIRQPVENLGVYDTKISGELIEFVKTQRAEGRTTGSCKNGGWWGNTVTFNGAVAGFESPLTWTENTITLGDTTVNQ